VVKPEQLEKDALEKIDQLFHSEVFPILTPIAIDPGHPFPHLRNKSLNLGVMFMREGQLEAGFGVVQVPMMLPRLLEVNGLKSADGTPSKHAYVLLEDLIARHVETICRRSSRSSAVASAATPFASRSRAIRLPPRSPSWFAR
jgi:polyphosphate kinase